MYLAGACGSQGARLVAVLTLLGVTGCSVSESYLITGEQLTQAAQVPPPEADHTALPVHRYVTPAPGRDVVGKAVFVRATTVQQGLAAAGGLPAVLRSRRYSPVVTGGVALTVIGSVISIAGSIVFFSTLNTSGDTNLISGVIALSAEPMMLAGTLMWIFGIQRPPQEVGAGRAGVRYLDAPVPLVTPAPAPALSLRF